MTIGRRVLSTAAAVLVAFAAPACATTQPGAAGRITVFGNLKTLEIAPVLLAAGKLTEPPLAVSQGGIPTLVGETSGGSAAAERADLGTHAETQLLRYSLRHPDLRVIMTVSEGHYRIVARRSAGISSVADLKGKRIAASLPTSSGYFLHRMLQQAGLSVGDVTIVPLREPTQAAALVAERKADAVAIWEPHSENALAALGGDAIEFSGKGVYRESFNLNSTAAVLADPAKRKQVVAFVRQVIRAAAMVEKDPREAQRLVAEASGFALGDVVRAWPHHSFPASLAPELLDTMVEEEKWLAAAERRAPRGREELDRLIDRSILAEAMAR